GPMVLSVCRRVLGDAHDAEDAFQATFLILARKASSAARSSSAGAWLHTVAYRVALRARSRRATHATSQQPLDRPVPRRDRDPAEEALTREVRRVIDEEVGRLPEKYRLPFVLFHLEGHSSTEVARDLGRPVRTIESWLARARARLRVGLARRGISPALALSDESLAPAVVPAALLGATPKGAGAPGTAAVAPPVASLVEEVLRESAVSRVKVALLVLLVVGMAGALGAAAAMAARHWAAPPGAGAQGPTPP